MYLQKLGIRPTFLRILSWIYCPYSQVTFSWIVKKTRRHGPLHNDASCPFLSGWLQWSPTRYSDTHYNISNESRVHIFTSCLYLVQNLRNKNIMIPWQVVVGRYNMYNIRPDKNSQPEILCTQVPGGIQQDGTLLKIE